MHPLFMPMTTPCFLAAKEEPAWVATIFLKQYIIQRIQPSGIPKIWVIPSTQPTMIFISFWQPMVKLGITAAEKKVEKD